MTEDVGAYVIDKNYFPTVEAVKRAQISTCSDKNRSGSMRMTSCRVAHGLSADLQMTSRKT